MKTVRGDFLGGITAGIIALPLALAFGVASGAGAAAGLYGAIGLGLFAAIFGGTKTQISGPTGPMTVVTASAVAFFSGNIQAMFMAVILAGFFQIILGFSKIGSYVKYIPYPVISGFMSGIGVIIILLQLNPLLGVDSVGSPLLAIVGLGKTLNYIDLESLFLGGLTLAIVFLTPNKISSKLPSPLIALLTVSLLAYFLGFSAQTIGEIPSQLPSFKIPNISLDLLRQIITFAITLAVLGTIDSLLTSLVADSITQEKHNSNKELIGQGIGNMVVGFLGGIAGAGATMRTVVNVKSGGKTRLSGIIHACFLIAVLLGLGPLTSHIPMAVLAGILVKVGIDILDYRLLKVIKRAPKHDLIVMIIVFIITVFVDLIIAVGVGVTLAAILITFRVAKQTQVNITEVPLPDDTEFFAKQMQEETEFQIRIISVQGPFFFGSTTQILDNVDKLLGTKVIIFNCSEVPFMDLSAIFALEEMFEKLQKSGIKIILVASDQIRHKLLGFDYFKKVTQERLVGDIEEATKIALQILAKMDS